MAAFMSCRARLLFWVTGVIASLFVVFLMVLPLQYKLPKPIQIPTRYANGSAIRYETVMPRIIHQTWKTGSSPPAETVRWRQGCMALNRDYEFRMYDDDELLEFTTKHYPEYLPLFKSLHGVYMADMARILVTYHYGGIYMDLDFYCHRPFHCLDGQLTSLAAKVAPGQTDLLAVSLEPTVHATIFRKKDRVVIQDFYMATPKHPFFKWFLDVRKEAFEKDPEHPAKGPFSYSIEKEIDQYKAAKATERQLRRERLTAAQEATNFKTGPVKFRNARRGDEGDGASNSTVGGRSRAGPGGRGGRSRGRKSNNSLPEDAGDVVDTSEGAIIELREDVLHALVDSSNSRLGKTCSQSPPPAIAKESCRFVNKGQFFRPTDSTIAVHMWTHVYLGWNLLRGAYNAQLYNSVEKTLPPTMACGAAKF